mgnify:CR=1 FL=1
MIRIWNSLDIERTPRRLFVFVQGGKALVGAVLGLGFVLTVGRPDLFEGLAIAGLLAPALVALRQWANDHVLAKPSRFEFVEAEGQTVSTRLVRQDGRVVEAGSVLAKVASR